MTTDTPDTSRAALEALADEAADRADTEAIPGGFDARVAATLRALAARVVELEDQNARLTGALKAVGGPHGYDPPARQDLQAIARTALEAPNAD